MHQLCYRKQRKSISPGWTKLFAFAPDFKQEPKFFGLVKIFQIHCDTKICQKYKNGDCRFHHDRCFADITIIPETYQMRCLAMKN